MASANKIPGFFLQTVLLGLLSGFFQTACSADDLRVLMAQSDSSLLYQSFAVSFKQNFPANIRQDLIQSPENFDAQKADLIVSVGVRAAYRVAEETTHAVGDGPGQCLRQRKGATGFGYYFEQVLMRVI